MTSDKRYAPTLTVGPTNTVELRLIYDDRKYRCEIREAGRMVKATNGDFLPTDRDLHTRVEKLMEVAASGLSHLVGMGSGNLRDYSVHLSIQPVLDIETDHVKTETQFV